MKLYDCIVVGAGPSGCQGARAIAKLGWKTLLIERVVDFSKNNFSSAGTVIEVMKEYGLPNSVVGTFWNTITLIGVKKKRSWSSPVNSGMVFDFQKLRKFLADDAKKHGADVLMGYTYKKIVQKEEYTELTFQKYTGENLIVGAKVIVDATGPARSVLYHNGEKPPFIADTGIEYLVRVNQKEIDISQNTLQFFLGSLWQPHGYAWIFPMGNNVFKIGTGLYDSPNQKNLKPLKFYVDRIIRDYLKLTSFEIIETHGSTLLVTNNHNERFYHENIIGIGDVISSVNSLGGEGIRHGMYSASVAAECVDLYLKKSIANFSEYEKRMRTYFGIKWRLSSFYSYLFYQKFSDWFIDVIISALGYLNTKEIIEILFYYKFSLMLKTIYRKFLLRKKFAVDN